jgi:hypothetical protein
VAVSTPQKGLLILSLGSCSFVSFGVFAAVLLFAAVFAIFGAGSAPAATPGGSSNVSNQIPSVLQPIFSKAADKHNMSVNFLGSIFWKEHGESWPTSGPWATSPAGANGPFQFILSTWAAHKEDCNGDGVEDVQNINDAACGAADLLAAIGARNVFDTSPASLASLRDAASKYNSGQPWSVGQGIPETFDYVTSIIPEYVKLVNTSG